MLLKFLVRRVRMAVKIIMISCLAYAVVLISILGCSAVSPSFQKCFAGDEDAPRDEETAKYWEQAGLSKDKIYFCMRLKLKIALL